MPVFSKTFNGLTQAAKVVFFWRPSSDNVNSQYSNGYVNMDGSYSASFEYPYDVEYTWSLYYGHYGTATTKIDGGTVYTASPAPSPKYSITYRGYSRVTALIENLRDGDSVRMTVYYGSAEVGYTTATADGATMSLSVDKLTAGTKYSVIVLVNTKSLGAQNCTMLTPSQTYDASFGQKSITVKVFNLGVGDMATFFFRKSSEDDALELHYTRATSSDSSSYSWTEEVEYNVEYIYSVRITYPNKEYAFLVSGQTFILDGFEWDTYIAQGVSMNMYNGKLAPVTASEWNRLVGLVNKTCGKSISSVSPGTPMMAGPGGNIRQVADALDVSVDSGDTITAQFFLDLKDKINNLL
jgi:hypothetical protein